jgi:hypothetical protein
MQLRLKEPSNYEERVIDTALINGIIPNPPIIETIFAPYLGTMFKKDHPIIKCSIETFKKRFKITSDVLSPMEKLWERHNFVIAGGKMIDFFSNKTLSESDNDYDVFFIESTLGGDNQLRTTLNDDKWTLIGDIGYLEEYTKEDIKIQLIQKPYASCQDIIEEFDFKACAICTDGKYVYWIKGAIKDIKNKQLTALCPRSTLNSMYRISKYLGKGYEIKTPDLAFIAIRFLDSLYEINPRKDEARFNRDFVFDRLAAHQEAYEELTEPMRA